MKFSGLTIVAPARPSMRATYAPANPPPTISVPPRASLVTIAVSIAAAGTRRRLGRPSAERRNQRSVHSAGARLVREVPDRAGSAGVVGDELGARVRADPARHAADERGVVDAPEAPLGERERLPRVRTVEGFRRRPGRAV